MTSTCSLWNPNYHAHDT